MNITITGVEPDELVTKAIIRRALDDAMHSIGLYEDILFEEDDFEKAAREDREAHAQRSEAIRDRNRRLMGRNR